MADADLRSIFEPDEGLEAQLDAAAMADYRAGRIVSQERVAEWLDSWGSGKMLPKPKPENH